MTDELINAVSHEPVLFTNYDVRFWCQWYGTIIFLIVQLKQERDVAVRENERLKAELAEERRGREEDRDEIEELRDRVANLRVQATSKMVSVLPLSSITVGSPL